MKNKTILVSPSERKDFISGILIWTFAIAVTLSFTFIVSDIFFHGIQKISLSFLTESPADAGRSGGISSIIVSTLLIVGGCMFITIPLGTATAVFLNNKAKDKSIYIKLIRWSLDILASVPSIVFGLFGSVFFCYYLNMGFSILSGSLTLSCMVLPIFIRVVEDGFSNVPEEYIQGSAALSLSEFNTLFKIKLPLVIPSLITGFVLGISRAVSETAALIFTSGYVDRMPESLWDSGRSMSVHIYDLVMNVPGGDINAYKTAFVLIALLILINTSTALVLKKHFRKGMNI